MEIKERIALLIVGANLPLALAALVVLAMGLRKPTVRWRVVLLLFGLGLGCVLVTVLGDVLLGIDLY